MEPITMECVAVMAASAAIIFARLAHMQGLNPWLWGFLALVVYAGVPAFMIWRGARLLDAPILWISPVGGLFVLSVIQCVVAAATKHRNR